MPNQRYKAIPLGFINTAQDTINIKDFEGQAVSNLDADKLALGTLSLSDYFTQTQKATPDFSSCEVAKTSFRINPTTEEVEYLNINDDWLSFKDVFADKSNDTGVQATVGVFDGVVGRVSITDTSGLNDPSTVEVRSGAGGTLSATPGGAVVTWEVTGYTPGVSLSYRYKYNDGGWNTGSVGSPFPTSVDWFPAGVPGTEFKINFLNLVVSDVLVFSLTSALFDDGEYSYKVVEKAKESGDGWLVTESARIVAKNSKAAPTKAPSDPVKIGIANRDSTGDLVNALTPSLDSLDSALPNTDAFKFLYYRRDPGQDGYYLVSNPLLKEDRTAGTVGRRLELDDVSITSMETLQELNTLDESETVINDAINNPDCKYVKIFDRNNRLFRVPKDRQDLLLYSRAVEWWGWQRENSFAFDGNIQAIVELRDPTTVGGELTLVIFTDNSIYHLSGTGSESNPYTLTRQIEGITVDPNSVVNTNGIIMFVTSSTDGLYNTGEYGQKVYEYDLQKLREVSARVQNSVIMLGTDPVEWAELLGGDKYIFKRENLDNLLVYHRDAEGWVEIVESEEQIDNKWFWVSKTFTNTDMERFKIGYARKFKIDFEGTIEIIFNVTQGQGGNTNSYSTGELTSGASRIELTHQLPPIKGTTWSFSVIGTNASLYKMYLVG